jgi:hypothetical protein
LALAREHLAKATKDATEAEQEYKNAQAATTENEQDSGKKQNSNGYGLVNNT